MNCILVVRSETRVKFGGRRFDASHFRGFWRARDKDREVFAHCKVKNLQNKWGQDERKKFHWPPQLRQLFDDKDLSTKLNATERRTRKTFEKVCRNFLCYKKGEKTVKFCRGWFIIQCCGIGHVIEITFSSFPFEFFFLEKMGIVSDEGGEGFHQNISQKEGK